MTVESAQDRASFFDTDDFGAVATYDGGAVNGIFTDESYEGGGQGGPMFVCQSSDIVGAVQGETITIGGKGYTIAGIQPDGTGVTELVLDEQ